MSEGGGFERGCTGAVKKAGRKPEGRGRWGEGGEPEVEDEGEVEAENEAALCAAAVPALSSRKWGQRGARWRRKNQNAHVVRHLAVQL